MSERISQEEARTRRESVKSDKVILRRDGTVEQLCKDTCERERDLLLKAFLRREIGIVERNETPPFHIEIMRAMELVDYEPASDIGHLRFYPKGALMKDLLEDLAEDIALRRLGAVKIETPLLYRAEQPDIAEQAASFHERDYRIKLEDRELLLRFAGDFGLFSMIKSAHLTYRTLPLRVYEISKSFRFEQSGECSGLKRLRGFTMPDIHCFCKDLPTALEEYALLYDFYDGFLNEAGLPFAVAFRTIKDFWKDHKQFLEKRLNKSKKDGLIEVLEEMKHYWNLKHEFQYIDSTNDGIQLSTVQLDISDSERYGLGYINADGQKKPLVIVHSSMGSVERILGAIIEERGKERQRGEKPVFPYWISPTQLRIIPVSSKHIPSCETLADCIPGTRVDIDDRDEKVGKKVRAAEREWIPAYVVIGDKEKSSDVYNLKLRGKEFGVKSREGIGKQEICEVLSSVQGRRPFRSSYLDRKVSRQLRFGSSY